MQSLRLEKWGFHACLTRSFKTPTWLDHDDEQKGWSDCWGKNLGEKGGEIGGITGKTDGLKW